MSAIYAFYSSRLAEISNESLRCDLKKIFRFNHSIDFSIQVLPFVKSKELHLLWDKKWGVGFSIDEPPLAIENYYFLNSSSNINVDIDRQLKISFGVDFNREYTNEVIFILEYIEKINGVVIFDSNKKLLYKS